MEENKEAVVTANTVEGNAKAVFGLMVLYVIGRVVYSGVVLGGTLVVAGKVLSRFQKKNETKEVSKGQA